MNKAIWLALIGAAACEVQQPETSSAGQAGQDADLEAAAPADGRAGTFSTTQIDVATWNLKEFPLVPSTPTQVAELISKSGWELIAVQEIGDRLAFESICSTLENFACAVQPAASATMRVGFAWDTTVLMSETLEVVFVDEPAFVRPGLIVRFGLVGTSTTSLTVLNVHLKAGKQSTNERQRGQAVVIIKSLADGILEQNDREALLILGDFNETPSDPMYSEVFAPFTDDPGHYRFLTNDLATSDHYTFLPAPLFFDHMIASVGLLEYIADQSPRVMYESELPADYHYTVSDHLPVTLRLLFSENDVTEPVN